MRRKELSEGPVNSMAYMVDSVWTDPQRTRKQIPDTLALTQEAQTEAAEAATGELSGNLRLALSFDPDWTFDAQ